MARRFMVGAALLCLLSTPATAQRSNDEPTRALQDVERSLSQSEARTRSLDAQLRALSREMRDMRRQMVEKADAIQGLEQEKSDLERRLTQLLQTEGELVIKLEQNREGFAGVLFALQRIARHPPEALLAQPTSPVETVRSAILLHAAVPEIEGRAGTMQAELAALERARVEINNRQVALADTARRLSRERRELDQLIVLKRQLREETEQQRVVQERKVRELARQAKSLRDLVNRLARLDEGFRTVIEPEPLEEPPGSQVGEIDEMIAGGGIEDQEQELALGPLSAQRPPELPKERRGESAEGVVAPAPSERGAERGNEPVTEANLISLRPFAEQRGRLPMPVVGRIEGRFGEKLISGLTRKGITVETRAGAQVVAPHEGRVAYAGPFRGYGLLLILEHGDGYHTLLAGMSRIDGELGQTVLAGEPVGVMADEEAAERPSLYVELRKQGEPINPMPWLAASTGKVNG
ncbi:MAG: murein hydrolase activator EnvC family protein [Magnetovibrionaceae bacterium]